MDIHFPFKIDDRGQTTLAEHDEHIRQMIEQVLFTMPGERVNRPEFGSGLSQLLFAPGSDEMATAVEFLVQGALQQWLGDLIQVEAIQVTHEETAIEVIVQYHIQQTQQRRVDRFRQGAPS